MTLTKDLKAKSCLRCAKVSALLWLNFYGCINSWSR